MEIQKIISRINKKLAGENLTYNDLEHLMDDVIDEINTSLNSTYPVFSELPQGTTEYTAFPDRYIRKVVVLGAAYLFYIEDEEGERVAGEYFSQYRTNLALMVRDHLSQVPEEYQGPDTGYAETTYETDVNENTAGVVLYDQDYGL